MAIKHTTLADIAARAGVASMTVSRVINRSGYVSREVGKRVQRAIRELDYRPNILARSLKKQRTHVVGILLPDIANPFSAELAQGIRQVLLARGYTAFLSTSDRSIDREQEALQAFFDHRVDGIIVATRATRRGNEALIRLTDRGMPLVVVGRDLRHAAMDRVAADEVKGGQEAVEHLILLGHRRIAFLGVSPSAGSGLRRYQGYLAALRARGLPLVKEWVVGPGAGPHPGYSTQEDGFEGMHRLLALTRRPTAVFARNDYTAMGAMRAVRAAGLSIPDDIAIVGFDNVPLSAFTSPPLTTVEQPTAEEGSQAATLLLDRIQESAPRQRREVMFECRLVLRESTGRGRPSPKALDRTR